MTDISIRISGRAGRITLQRPEALNAMTYQMCLAIEAALDAWRDDDAVALVIFDAEGDRAFCAGGDIAELYETGTKGDYAYGQRFWADEYRLNHKIFHYTKPVVSFLQGFTMGGGVGIGCHGSHRVVGETGQIAMPECGIGLVPDVGGSFILARAPGAVGAYLGTTAARMDASDAIYAGFADSYLPEAQWANMIAELEKTGSVRALESDLQTPAHSNLQNDQAEIDSIFAKSDLQSVLMGLQSTGSAFAEKAHTALSHNSPLSLACTLQMLHRLKHDTASFADALTLEYRFTARAMEHGDLLEGIRAAIIDKDRQPKWRYADMHVPQSHVDHMLAPLEGGDWTTEG